MKSLHIINIGKYLSTGTGRIILSVLLGVGLAAVCKSSGQFVWMGPNKSDLAGVYKWGGQCYTIESEAVSCRDESKKVVPLTTAAMMVEHT